MAHQAIIHNIGRFLDKNSTYILAGVAIGGVFTTPILAVKATPKALDLIKEADAHTNLEKIKASWKCYIPTCISCIITVASIIELNGINQRRNAAIAGLYSIAQTTLKEYQEKVIETIGENKERKIRDSIDADRIINNPPSNITITGNGDVLCYDSVNGRYFNSDIEKIRKAVNELNTVLLNEMFIPANDLYYELGLRGTTLGDDLGFNLDTGLIEIKFSSQLTNEGKPCLVLNYEVEKRL